MNPQLAQWGKFLFGTCLPKGDDSVARREGAESLRRLKPGLKIYGKYYLC